MSGTGSPPQRSNVALIVSLCVNLLLAGVIAMAVLRFVLHGPVFMQGRPEGPGVSMQHVDVRRALSPQILMRIAPDQADRIRGIIGAHRPRIDALRSASFAARSEVLRLLGSPVFDKTAFDKALARMQVADAAVETEILKVASESVMTLTPEERQKVAAWRAHDRSFGGRWRHGQQGGPMEDAPPPPQPQQPPP